MARWNRYRECGRKKQHKSKGAAEAQIRALVKCGQAEQDELRSYPCVFCQGWHVGHRREGEHENKYRRGA